MNLIIPELFKTLYSKYCNLFETPVKGDVKLSLIVISFIESIIENRYWEYKDFIPDIFRILIDSLTRHNYHSKCELEVF